MKKTYLKSFCARCLTLLVLALLSTNLAWGADDVVATFKSEEVVTSSSYATYSNDDWCLSKGGNSFSCGFNKSNKTQITNVYGTGATATDHGYTITSINKLENVYKITFVFTGQSANGTPKLYLGYSTDGSTWNAVPLESGDGLSAQGVITSNANTTYTFEFTSTIPSAYYAIVHSASQQLTTNSHLFRFDYVTATFYKKNASSKTLESIAISGKPTKTTYEAGEEFDPTGLVVTGTYTEGDPEVITSGIDWTITPNPLTVGITSVNVTAKVGNVTSDAYVVNGLTVKAIEGDRLTLASTGVSGSSYAEWSGKTGSEGVAVYAGKCAGSYNSIQLNTSNNPGIVSTTSGGLIRKVKVDWNSNTSSGRSIDIYGSNTAYTGSGDIYNTEKQGTKLGSIVCGTSTELEISGDYEYVGVRAIGGALYMNSITFVWEAPKTLSSIAVTTLPEKKVYKVGESFDAKGLVVTGTYTDETSEPLSPTQYSLSTPDMSSVGRKTITVSATGVEDASFTIDVVALDKIEVTTPPTKTEYNEGENFDPAGMVVKATWGTEVGKTIVENNLTGYTVTDGTNLQPTQTSVTISYTHEESTKTTTQEISVTAAANKYTVTFTNVTEEGTLTVKVGDEEITTGTELVEGVIVSLTSTPNSGYKQNSTPFEVKDADGEKVNVSKSGDVYSFTMPAKGVTITAKFVAIYKINVADGQGGTIAIQDATGNPITETSKGSKVVVAVTPEEHYSLASLYYVKEGEETQNEIPFADDKYSFTMPQTAVTVYATFAEDAKYTVSFSVNGENTTSDANYAGEPVEFPENPSVEGYTFMGWTTEAINGTQDNAPTFVDKETAVYPADNSTVYYAVFAEEEEGEVTWNIITSANDIAANDVIIIATNKGYTAHTMKTAGTIAKSLMSCMTSTFNSDKTQITSVADGTLEFTLGGNSTSGWTLQNGTSYLGMSGEKKVDLSSTSSTWSISISSEVATVSQSYNSKSYSLQYNYNDGDDRFTGYASNQVTISLYKKTQGITYSNYCTTVPPRTFTKTISNRKMATLYLDYAVTIPENVKAYTATDKDDSHTAITLEKITDGVIPANTGVIVYADVETNTSFDFVETATTKTYDNNCLKGVTKLTAFNEVADYNATKYNYYALMAGEGTSVVFKLVSAGSYAANSAYLVLPKTANAKVDFTFDDEPTGIESLQPSTLNPQPSQYNLNGVRVNNGYKGIVIMNGKKYINK